MLFLLVSEMLTVISIVQCLCVHKPSEEHLLMCCCSSIILQLLSEKQYGNRNLML